MIVNEEVLAICTLFIIGIIGSAFHITIIVMRFKLQSMKQNFYTFVASLAVTDLFMLLIFMFWCAPCIIFGVKMDSYWLTNIPGFIMFSCWHMTIHILLLISTSRFVAVYFPVTFRDFEKKHVKVGLIVTLIWSCVIATPLLFEPCTFYFDSYLFVYTFGDDSCSFYYDKISFAYDTLVCNIGSLVFNWATFYKIRHKKSQQSHTETIEDRRKRQREISFFIQSTVSGSVNIVLVLLFHVVVLFVNTRLGLFFCTTATWEFAHVLNGVIFLIGNAEARRATIGKIWPVTAQPVGVATTSLSLATVRRVSEPRVV